MSNFTIAAALDSLPEADLDAATAPSSTRLSWGPLSTPADVARTTRGADALLVTLQPLRAEHIDAIADSVRVIARAGVGLDTIDVDHARSRGIRVIYQPTYATNEVADHAVSLALASWRRVARADQLVRSEGWVTARRIGPVRALQESTAGVVGAGRIGRAVISRLRPFVSRIVAFDEYRGSDVDGAEWADSLEELLECADLLTLHVPLSAQSRHLIDAPAIDRLPAGAVVVNVSRGGLVDEDALSAALHSGRVGAAALDVFDGEPLSEHSPLRSAPNLLLTPHIAWYSIEAGRRMADWSVADVVTFLDSGAVSRGVLA